MHTIRFSCTCTKLARYLIASHWFRFTLGASPPILRSDAAAHLVGLPLANATRWRGTGVACFSPCRYAVRQKVEHGQPHGCLEIFLSYRFRGISSGSCSQGFESSFGFGIWEYDSASLTLVFDHWLSIYDTSLIFSTLLLWY